MNTGAEKLELKKIIQNARNIPELVNIIEKNFHIMLDDDEKLVVDQKSLIEIIKSLDARDANKVSINYGLRDKFIELISNAPLNKSTFVHAAPISEIPADQYFVSESNHAFNLEELLEAFSYHSYLNPYTRKSFTLIDFAKIYDMELAIIKRNPAYEPFLKTFIKSNGPYLSQIKKNTIDELRNFIENVGFLDPQRKKITDGRRALALLRFHQYYNSISQEEKDTLNNIPVLQNDFNSYRVENIEAIFGLKADECLGGISGLVKTIIDASELYNNLSQFYHQESQQKRAAIMNLQDSSNEREKKLRNK